MKNFSLENEKIQVFDKYKVQVRPQNIMDVAMENYFYDIDFMKAISKEERQFSGVTEEEFKNIVIPKMINNVCF